MSDYHAVEIEDRIESAQRRSFAVNLAMGLTPMQALRGAGYSPNHTLLASLLLNEDVQLLVREYRADLTKASPLPTSDDYVRKATRLSEEAQDAEAFGSAVGALQLAAKISGVMDADMAAARSNVIRFIPLKDRIIKLAQQTPVVPAPDFDIAG